MADQNPDDFYEDDEPVEKVMRAFQRGEKIYTEPPRGVNAVLEFTTPPRAAGAVLYLPDSLRVLEPQTHVPTSAAQRA